MVKGVAVVRHASGPELLIKKPGYKIHFGGPIFFSKVNKDI